METNELKQLHPKQLCCNEHSKTSLPDTFKHLFPWEMKTTNLHTLRAIPKVSSSSPPQKSSAYTPPVSPPLCLFQTLYKVSQSKYHSCPWSLHTLSWLAKQAISPNLSRSTLSSTWVGKTEIKTKDLGSLWMAIVLHYYIVYRAHPNLRCY